LNAAQWIYNTIIKKLDSPYEYAVFATYSRSIIHCSEGKAKESDVC
jgi:hypothetical protein